MDKIAFKCYDCNTINIFPKHKADGNRCINCKGMLAPIGEAIDSKENKSNQCIHKFLYLKTTYRGAEEEDLFYCERCLKYEKRIRPR